MSNDKCQGPTSHSNSLIITFVSTTGIEYWVETLHQTPHGGITDGMFQVRYHLCGCTYQRYAWALKHVERKLEIEEVAGSNTVGAPLKDTKSPFTLNTTTPKIFVVWHE